MTMLHGQRVVSIFFLIFFTVHILNHIWDDWVAPMINPSTGVWTTNMCFFTEIRVKIYLKALNDLEWMGDVSQIWADVWAGICLEERNGSQVHSFLWHLNFRLLNCWTCSFKNSATRPLLIDIGGAVPSSLKHVKACRNWRTSISETHPQIQNL